jgi:hypothetical protein
MPGVPREVAEHSLELNETARPVKKKLRRFAQDRKETIRVELNKLLAAGFICECKHPDWLANPVLVKKKPVNGECASITPVSISTAIRTPFLSPGSTRSWIPQLVRPSFASSIAILAIIRSL